MTPQLLKLRYWNLYREAIEAFVNAVEENKNGIVIHSLERVIKIRERDLDQIAKDASEEAA